MYTLPPLATYVSEACPQQQLRFGGFEDLQLLLLQYFEELDGEGRFRLRCDFDTSGILREEVEFNARNWVIIPKKYAVNNGTIFIEEDCTGAVIAAAFEHLNSVRRYLLEINNLKRSQGIRVLKRSLV